MPVLVIASWRSLFRNKKLADRHAAGSRWSYNVQRISSRRRGRVVVTVKVDDFAEASVITMVVD